MPRKTLYTSRECGRLQRQGKQSSHSGLGGWLLCLVPTLPRGSCQEYRGINRLFVLDCYSQSYGFYSHFKRIMHMYGYQTIKVDVNCIVIYQVVAQGGKRYKNRNKSKKPPSVNAEDRPSGLADDSASLGFGLSFLFACAVACVWLGERSEPTCIKTSTRHGAKTNFCS